MPALRNGIGDFTLGARVLLHGRRVSPHPDPLPEERGQPASLIFYPVARSANPVTGFSKTQEPILLLPGGEGRDEGEGVEQTNTCSYHSGDVYRVSPHPSPLPGERGQPVKFLSHSVTSPANPVAGFSKVLEPILLLPGGEGRDEGEGDHQPAKRIFTLIAKIQVRAFRVVDGCRIISQLAAISKH
jgi:hypothetical protein